MFYNNQAVQYNYQIEIIEPNTPWRKNVTLLSQKNKHNVEMATIRRTLSDFESVNLPGLIEECQNEIKKESVNKKRLSPTGILNNLNLEQNNWSSHNFEMGLSNGSTSSVQPSPAKHDETKFYLNESISVSKLTDITATDSEYFDCKSKDTESQFGSNKSEDDDFKSFSLNEAEMPDQNLEMSESINESVEVLKSMFPSIERDVIADFLNKYQNDLNTVTNILLDSVNFLEMEKSNEAKKNLTSVSVYQVKSLQEICLIEMEKLELAMENLNNKIQIAKSNAKVSSSALSSPCIKRRVEFNRTLSLPKDLGESAQCESKMEDDEPIIHLKIDKLRTLIDLFGTADELRTFNDSKK